MNIDETTLIQEIQKVHMDASQRKGEQKSVNENAFDNNLEYPREEKAFDTNLHSASNLLKRFTYISYTVRN